MKLIAMAMLAAAVLVCGCKKESSNSGPKVTTQLKIRIGVNGEIFANNKQLTDDEFALELQRLQKDNGGIVYSRENPGEATEAQGALLRLINEAGIPLEYTTKP